MKRLTEQEIKERRIECTKKWEEKNKQKIKEYNHEYYLLNKHENNKRCQTYRAKNRTKINEYNQYYKNIFNANHPGYYLLYRKEYRKNNQERFNMWSKKYYKNGGKERAKKKYYNDKLTRLKICLRGRIYYLFKKMGIIKSDKTEAILGAQFSIVKEYLEKKFQHGMNWSNYGKWHIDHIIPLAKAKNKNELIILCHYTNLQPLWAKDNLSKSKTIPEEKYQQYLKSMDTI